MDAVEFLKTRARICRVYDVCEDCPIESFCSESYDEQDEGNCIINIVNCVERWAKEHPVKTRQSEFLKLFPNASIGYNGTLVMCPSQADTTAVTECVRSERNCDKCKRDFWLKEID